MVNTLDLFNYIASALCILLSFILLNYLLIFIKFRRLRIISSRRPISSITIATISFIGLLYERTSLFYYYNLTNPYNNIFPYWEASTMFIYFCSGILSMYIITYRAFVFYFNIKFNQALEDSKWRLFIDPKESENNWFLKHKSHFPKLEKFIFIIIFSIWFILTIFVTYICIIYKYTTSIHRGILLIAALIPTILNSVLLCKFPKYDDIFHIRSEIKLSLIFQVLMLIIFFAVSIIFNIQGGTFAYLIQAFSAALMEFILAIIGTGYVLHKNGLPSNVISAFCVQNDDRILREIMRRDVSSSGSRPDFAVNNDDDEKKEENEENITLKTILENEDSFALFARHLSREFSVENLLFFLETTQWLESFGRDKLIKDHKNQLSVNGDQHIVFPDNVPRSRIVFSQSVRSPMNADGDGVVIDENGMIIAKKGSKYNDVAGDDKGTAIEMEELNRDYEDLYYLQCIRIFNKYITNDSFFCINISGGIRKGLYDLISFNDYDKIQEMEMVGNLKENIQRNKKLVRGDGGNDVGVHQNHEEMMQKQVDDLFKIYDNSRDETFKLMDYAVGRFKQTSKFSKWLQQR